MTFRITLLRIKGLFGILSIKDTQHNDIQHNDTRYEGLICDTQNKRRSA